MISIEDGQPNPFVDLAFHLNSVSLELTSSNSDRRYRASGLLCIVSVLLSGAFCNFTSKYITPCPVVLVLVYYCLI